MVSIWYTNADCATHNAAMLLCKNRIALRYRARWLATGRSTGHWNHGESPRVSRASGRTSLGLTPQGIGTSVTYFGTW